MDFCILTNDPDSLCFRYDMSADGMDRYMCTQRCMNIYLYGTIIPATLYEIIKKNRELGNLCIC